MDGEIGKAKYVFAAARACVGYEGGLRSIAWKDGSSDYVSDVPREECRGSNLDSTNSYGNEHSNEVDLLLDRGGSQNSTVAPNTNCD